MKNKSSISNDLAAKNVIHIKRKKILCMKISVKKFQNLCHCITHFFNFKSIRKIKVYNHYTLLYTNKFDAISHIFHCNFCRKFSVIGKYCETFDTISHIFHSNFCHMFSVIGKYCENFDTISHIFHCNFYHMFSLNGKHCNFF